MVDFPLERWYGEVPGKEEHMEVIHVGLQMQDPEAARILARTLAAESRHMHFHLEEGDFDLIVTDDGQNEMDGANVVRLCRFREQEDPENKVLWRFADAEEIADGLIYAYYLISGRVLEYRQKRDHRLIVFASARGGCGVTSLCLSVARKLAENHGRKTLYINTSLYDDSMRYFWTENKDLQKGLMLRLRRGSTPPMKVFIREGDQVDRIPGARDCSVFPEVTEGEMAALMRAVSSCGKYDVVMIDAGSALIPCNRNLIASADLLVSVRSGNGRDRFSEERRIGIEALAKRVIRVENFSDPVSQITRKGYLQAAWEPEAFVTMNGSVRIELNNAYGMDVAEIAARIEEESEHDGEYEAYHAGDPGRSETGPGSA